MSLRSRTRLPLRARVTVTFAVLGALTAATVSTATYLLARTYMLEQRERFATRQAFLDARIARDALTSSAPSPEEVIARVTGEPGSQILLHYGDQWFTSAIALDPSDLPSSLVDLVTEGGVGHQRISTSAGPSLVTGVPLDGGQFYEVVSLRELQRTLSIIATSLIVASLLTSVIAATAGLLISRRLLRPLRRMASSAVQLANGGVDERLDARGDSDLEPLADSINAMVGALQHRIDREARFASDVSHELRTPLTALSTAVEVVRSNAAEMPPRAAQGVDLLATQVAYFERLVLDLLEISRFDAGAETVNLETIDVIEYFTSLSRRLGGPDPETAESASWMMLIDKRRIERVVANLFENAAAYAGHVTRVTIQRRGNGCVLTVEDAGPGIPPGQRDRIFERFWRGPQARHLTSRGSGLGLALAAEHVKLLRGIITVRDNAPTGAVFVIELSG